MSHKILLISYEPYHMAQIGFRIFKQVIIFNLDPVPAHKRGGVQLWQFLRQLLDNPERRNIIHWTRQGHDGEFKLLDPEEVARL